MSILKGNLDGAWEGLLPLLGLRQTVEPSQLGLLFGKGVTVAYQQPTFLRASAIPGTGSEDGRTPRPCVYSHS